MTERARTLKEEPCRTVILPLKFPTVPPCCGGPTPIIEEDGKERRVLNQKETMLAQQKQQAIKEDRKSVV